MNKNDYKNALNFENAIKFKNTCILRCVNINNLKLKYINIIKNTNTNVCENTNKSNCIFTIYKYMYLCMVFANKDYLPLYEY